MKIFTFCLLLASLLVPACIFAQASFGKADSLAGHFITTLRKDDKERIIMQTDRKVYAAGEQIWFKAFLVRALNNRVDTISKTLYTDIVDDNDKTVARLVLNAGQLKTNGMLRLADTLHSGYYWMRCYTKRMIETDTADIFVQPLYVVNPRKPEALSRQNLNAVQPGEAVVEFFPEGGSIITGINSAGAVRVTDDDGDPIITTGYVVNNKDSIITNFTTNKFGLARINFYPLWFDKYTIVVNSSGHTVKLPIRSFNGYATRISVLNQTGEFITTTVALEDSIYSRQYVSFILGVSKDSVCFAGIGRGMYQVDIPAKNFPGGIATLLLFDEQQHLLSERKIFINRDNYTLNVQPDKQNYDSRDMAKLAVTLTDADGNPLVGAINIAIDDDKVARLSDELESDTLQPGSLSLNDWLLLQKRKIGTADIDLLMLAQEPEFKTRLAGAEQAQPYKAMDDTSLFYLQGKILDKRNTPQAAHIVTAVVKNSAKPFVDIDTTKADGSFKLNVPYNVDSLKMFIKVTDRYGVLQHDRIALDTFRFPSLTTPVSIKKRFATTNVAAKQQLRSFHVDSVFIGTGKDWLKPVTVKAKAKAPLNYIQQKRQAAFSDIITSEKIDELHITNLATLMYTIPGISLVNGKVTFYGTTGYDGGIEPILIVDGVQMTIPADTNMPMPGVEKSPLLRALSLIDPRTIDFIEVLKGANAAIYGGIGGHGVIVINTKGMLTESNYYSYGITEVQPVTYHTPPAFPMPDYSQRWMKNDKTPDQRNTIFWNSNVVTGADGKAAVNFYTADGTAPYTVIITGITARGDYIYKRMTIERK